MSHKIIVIEDDKKISAMLRRGLTYEGFDVITAENGRKGLLMVLEEIPDLVILDVMMPGIDGLEVCRRLRKEGNIPILMVTARDTVEDRVRGLETGADDYLVKPFAFEELVARVKALLRRAKGDETKDRLQFADLILDLNSRTAFRGKRSIELSTTEFDLLSFFMNHPQRVLTRELIMEKVWGFDHEGESNVLEVYVGYLRRKLEEQGESRLIHTVRGAGYVMKE
ncbi:response regulator transcription factor [Effusibacillus lacus]|uniref:DNA-binding response regulator n=1 Tax=Effusibacillus lacus TaxID=1348429 RepID=A0A292YT14_9BACL|nr:response regulator transcription factor [Effusibacillus lacus]TCS74956.1 two-component system response regulator MprA [Effusibacillus lacus]GAX91625.1 DNA-binding response regulator [Effusibacillus lacus]